MKFNLRKYAAFTLLLLFMTGTALFVSSCTATDSRGRETMVSSEEKTVDAHEKERIVQGLIAKKAFLGLFRKAREIGVKNEHGVYIINDAVLAYIKSCCEDKDAALALLKRNGFEVWEGGKYDPKKSSKVKLPYDEEIYGEKRVSSFLYTWISYKISLYVTDGKVAEIFAYTYGGSL